MNDLELPSQNQQQGRVFSQEDLVELGGTLASTGLTTLEARAFVNMVAQLCQQATLNAAPDLLEQVRRIHASRIGGIMQRIRALPTLGGYVNRDRVIQIVQDTYSTTPRS